MYAQASGSRTLSADALRAACRWRTEGWPPCGFGASTPSGICLSVGARRELWQHQGYTLQLKGIEDAKIECARKFFFAALYERRGHGVKYDVLTNYTELMQLVAG